ncbi:MAG TPA: hypothetical protein VMU16_08635 [Candidatus Binataceae bacterium]|nr:hypothetical protein [Candidatus Binataceae bacterium]
MSWRTEWHSISERIAGLIEAGTFMTSTAATVGSDYHGASMHLIGNAKRVYEELVTLSATYSSALPPRASACLSSFVHDASHTYTQSHLSGWSGMQGALAPLGSFRAEFGHLISDTESVVRNLAERAFLHLQYSIIANAGIRETWKAAFSEGEIECEKLGATHLLQFGIWAFKAVAPGERTDLVLGKKLEITPQIESASEGLVLTEWKVVRKPSELGFKAKQALEQAKLYGLGALAGFELSSRRYLVLVSERYMDLPPNQVEGGVDYQYKNIAVDPVSPSKKVKKD